MSIDTISDVLTRISGIEQQIQQLQGGSLPATTSAAGSSTASTAATDFASQLAQAQGGAATTAGASSFGTLADSALGASVPTTTSATATGVATTGTTALPGAAGTMLTAGQQQFAATLSADTGLNPSVVTAWLLAEESGGAAQSRQSAGNNDWLNIGYTDSGTYGSNDSVWSDPVSAAGATAAWLKGQDSIPGYGTASSGIQAILASVGQTPAAQIQAIQQSGWSSGGYPSLGSLYDQVATS